MTPALDWRDPGHYARSAMPCRYCGDPTRLRDDERHPAHKVCAEDAPAGTEAPAVGLQAAAGAARARDALDAARRAL